MSPTIGAVAGSFRRGGGGGGVAAAPHRYWRIYITAIPLGGVPTIAELELRANAGDQDQTPGGFVTANSATWGAAANAVDNNLATYWGGNTMPGWLACTFNSPVAVNEVVITARNDLNAAQSQTATAFEVQSSDDGTTWTTEWSESGLSPWTTSETRTFTRPGAVAVDYPYVDTGIVNPGAEAAVAEWTNTLTPTISRRSGFGHSGSWAFAVAGTGAFESYRDRPVPAALLTDVDAGTITATLGAWGYAWSGSTSVYRLKLSALDASNNVLDDDVTADFVPGASHVLQAVSVPLPVGTRNLRITALGTAAVTNDCWFDDLSITYTQ